jgi:glycosyltransferase involved in cell wall biosynthesis
MPKRDIADLLAASSAASSCVIDVPALWNNSANKFFDALAAGRPIIINHEGWLADVIRKERIGLVLPPDNFDAAADVLHKFLIDSNGLTKAGQSAARLAHAEFGRDVLAANVLEVLMEYAKGQRESAISHR